MRTAMIYVALEVIALLTTVVLAALWIRDGSGRYEAWIVLFGVIGGGIELYRRSRPVRQGRVSPELIIEGMRVANAVRALRPLEDNKRLEQLPNGVFGFTVPWGLERIRDGNPYLSLTRSKRGTANVEIHKSASGQIFVIGFVSSGALVQLDDPSRTAPIHVPVFFEPYDEFVHPVCIAWDRIIEAEHRDIDGADLCDMIIR